MANRNQSHFVGDGCPGQHIDRPATAETGCLRCATEFPKDQVVFNGDDGWQTTCGWCGLTQPWSWIKEA